MASASIGLSRRKTLLGLGAALTSAGSSPVRAQVWPRRVAFVLANWRYPMDPLLGPKMDREKVSKAVSSKGFEIQDVPPNFKKAQISKLIPDIASKVGAADDVFIYYSGHGEQTGAQSYFLPVDTQFVGKRHQPAHSKLSLDELIGAVSAKGPRSIVAVIDACRDDPSQTNAALPEPDTGTDTAPRDTIIAFSTLPGFQTPDAQYNQNSPYTSVFLSTLNESAELGIVDFFMQLQLNAPVAPTAPGNVQMQPWITDISLPNRPFFAPTREKSDAIADIVGKFRRPAVRETFDFARDRISVFFDADHSSVRQSEWPTLLPIALWMMQHSAASLLLVGYAAPMQVGWGSVSAQTYLIGLGERRAQAVRDFLVTTGIDGARIVTMGVGIPLDLQANAEAYASANRVTIMADEIPGPDGEALRRLAP